MIENQTKGRPARMPRKFTKTMQVIILLGSDCFADLNMDYVKPCDSFCEYYSAGSILPCCVPQKTTTVLLSRHYIYPSKTSSLICGVYSSCTTVALHTYIKIVVPMGLLYCIFVPTMNHRSSNLHFRPLNNKLFSLKQRKSVVQLT